jgi:hypothetical protein
LADDWKKGSEDTLMATADGIEGDDWERVVNLAVELGDARDGSAEEQASRRELLIYLQKLQSKYGPLASILSALGNFTEDYEQKESLLLRAYAAAETGDRTHLLHVSHSLTEMYMVEIVTLEDARTWLDRLDAHVCKSDDSAMAEDAQRFREELNELDALRDS